MNLMPWKKQHTPARITAPMNDLQQEMNRLLSRFFGDAFPAFDSFPAFPAITVSDNATAITVTAELPGIAANEVEVEVDGNLLTIRGEKRDEKKDDADNWHRVERSYGSFLRRIELPSAVDAAHTDASLEKGVLTLKLPKLAGETGKTIKVQAK